MPKRRPLIILVLLLLAFFAAHTASAQRFLGAFSAGMNVTQVDGDDFYGFHKVGLNIGPMVAMPFGKDKKWSVSMELLYSQKGSYHNGAYDSTTYRLVQDYVEIPVLVHFTDRKLISGGLGFAYGQLVNYKETHNSLYDSTFNYLTGLSNVDLSVIADVQIRLWNKLWADVRYEYSVKPNRTVQIRNVAYPQQATETRKQYNNVISLRLIWYFNMEKRTKSDNGKSSSQPF